MKFKNLYDAIVLKPVEEQEEMYGNIVVPDMANENNIVAEVVEVGPGWYTPTGKLIPTELKPGDKVILPTMGFTQFKYEGEKYLIGKEREVLTIIKEEENE